MSVGHAGTAAPSDDSAVKYAMVMSMQDKAEDKDLLIIRKQGNLYSFKYCRANNNGPVEEVLHVRKDYFVNQTKYEDAKVNDETIGKLFTSSVCQTVGHESYGVVGNKSIFNYIALGIIGTLVGSPFAYIAAKETVEAVRARRLEQNTETVFRYFFSSKFPHAMVGLTIAFLGLVSGGGYLTYREFEKNNALSALDEGTSYRFKADRSAVAVEGSMADFMKDFEAGLQLALDKGLFIVL
jgi:hypothetical protein